MDSNFDNENYWNDSSRSAFNFDDDGAETGLKSLIGLESNLDPDRILIGDTISEASFDNTTNALNLSINSIISEDALKMILEEQTLDDHLVSKGASPEDELKLLRRQVQSTLYVPTPSLTVHKFLLGKRVSLEVYKSLSDKEQLLDSVLESGCPGDAFLLAKRSKALHHFISFWKNEKGEEVISLLRTLGRHVKASLLQLQRAFDISDTSERKCRLVQLSNSFLPNSPVTNLYNHMVQGSIKLLEIIENHHNVLDNKLNINSTPIEVLFACCRKNANWKDQDMKSSISPYRVCVEQEISSSQFEWTALNERANAQAYADLDLIFECVPTWYPMKQKQFHISFSVGLAILRLYELQAPTSVLYMFLARMTSASEKLTLAKKVKCTKAIIDALVSLKDMDQLLQLRNTLPERSEEQFYCDSAIKNAQNKRWTTESIKLNF
ncbi:vacuolar protein sorting-associated protein 16B isoform X2 [Glossina fuscipes]|uniref:Vacuolar protein sorting-associated protein 16B isoform X2 n=1 Tax=Glossina fuscipes TaxID=7396 RepID=A0A9C5Z843_9MUSC|nr:vacuolar protein sorting-associated protein 16B isoform X2 [Glossina fuscipes]